MRQLSIRRLASNAGISHSQIVRIESGDFDCTVNSYVAICGALGIRFSDLLERCTTLNGDLYWNALANEFEKPLPKQFQTDQKSLNALRTLAFGSAIALGWLLRVTSPRSHAIRLIYPRESLMRAFISLAIDLESNPLALNQRVALLRQLQEAPLATLVSTIRFPTSEAVAEQVAQDSLSKKSQSGSWWPLQMSSNIEIWDQMEPSLEFIRKENDLTQSETPSKVSSVKTQLPNLLERLKKATAETGKKSELAEFLSRATGGKVPLASVSRWLSGEREPGGEVALQMDAWVTAEGYPRGT